jgi:hypothetical protein
LLRKTADPVQAESLHLNSLITRTFCQIISTHPELMVWKQTLKGGRGVD